MCGIVGKISSEPHASVQLDLLGLMDRLGNRGYDGAGVCVVNSQGEIETVKKGGKLHHLQSELKGRVLEGSIGIGHTRWGTHGPDTDENAHPHLSSDGKIALVHNGQIQNHAELKRQLLVQGYTFESDVDSEVLVNLIAREY